MHSNCMYCLNGEIKINVPSFLFFSNIKRAKSYIKYTFLASNCVFKTSTSTNSTYKMLKLLGRTLWWM